MSDPTIPDKAVTAAAREIHSAYATASPKEQRDARTTAREALEAALPHLADQPATDDRPVCPCATDDSYVHPGEQPADQPATTGETAVLEVIDERDNAEQWADRLAYAIAPVEVIGEHSSGNNPWANALDLFASRQSADRDTETAADEFAGFYITNDDGYPALTYYPHEDEDGECVKFADAGTSLDELVKAAHKHRAASLRGGE